MKSLLLTIAQLSRNGLGAPLLVVTLLGMLVLPLPPIGLDIFFTFNISLSLVVLLVAIYTLRPLNFATFPTVLLIATMLRLALNVASTRVVLVEGHTGPAAAGHVIESFGNFVIGGNFTVGLVVFGILVIINFVVVTKGAGRVSEVSARFTLDSMPGKQMAVDADLNAGMITQEEAKTRREEIAREADFYGSMDGSSKFVRGDAVAGILVLFINIVGGLLIGICQHHLSFGEALHNYTLLTVGDGLVAQIPALMLSTATAIIVTRVSSSQNMGEQVMHQMFSDPRALAVTAVILGVLGMIPGMPNLVFLMVSALCGWTAHWIARKRRGLEAQEQPLAASQSPADEKDVSWEDVKPVDVVGLEVGYRLIPLVDPAQSGRLMGRIKGVRRKLSQEFGFLVPPVHIRDNLELTDVSYRIYVLGVREGEAEVYPDRELAINPGTVYGEIQGIPAKDPAFQMDALWIEPAQRDHAQTLGYTVVDASTVIATHLSKLLQEHAHQLLGYEEAQQLIETLSRSAPKLAEDLVPKALSLGILVRVLQNLLAEDVPIRDMRTIAEAMVQQAVASQDPDALTAAARVALRRMIVQQINGIEGEMPVITLAPTLEQLLLKSTGEGGLAIEPGLAERLFTALSQTTEAQELKGQPVVLLVAPALRHRLAALLRPSISNLHVLAYNEIPEKRQVRVISSIGENPMSGYANSLAA